LERKISGSFIARKSAASRKSHARQNLTAPRGRGGVPDLPARDFAGFRCGLYALRIVDDWIYIEALLTAAPSFRWEERFWPSGGGDQQSFFVALDDLVPLLRLPPVLRAVRRFVVGLARKGTVWWQQSHCPALANLFFDT
jgi:hypothetical protein